MILKTWISNLTILDFWRSSMAEFESCARILSMGKSAWIKAIKIVKDHWYVTEGQTAIVPWYMATRKKRPCQKVWSYSWSWSWIRNTLPFSAMLSSIQVLIEVWGIWLIAVLSPLGGLSFRRPTSIIRTSGKINLICQGDWAKPSMSLDDVGSIFLLYNFPAALWERLRPPAGTLCLAIFSIWG